FRWGLGGLGAGGWGLASRGFALVQEPMHRGEQRTWFKRLRERARRAKPGRGLEQVDLHQATTAGHRDDQRLWSLGPQGPDDLQAVPLGHEDVDEHEIGPLL